MIAPLILFGVVFVVSWSGVGLFRRWSLHRNLLDIPNDRSSHSKPTPRGGGVVIVAVSLLAYAAIAVILDAPASVGYFVGAIIVALVSWLDDLYSLPFWARLIAHFTAASILVLDSGFWQTIFVPVISIHIPLGPVIGLAVTVAWIVWMVNAYNFMDGIDGIAGLQAVIACVAWAVILYKFNLQVGFLFAGVLACSSAGFLIHNWQPARIFMGDVGSAFLGFTLGAMPIIARTGSTDEPSVLPIVALLFVWFFVFDTVFTLIKRTLQRERLWEAHRQHLYQRMVIRGWKHSSVSLLYGSAAAILSVMGCLSIMFGGNYELLILLSVVVLTASIIYLAYEKGVDVRE